ncbi:hypothetical protein [Pseudothauera rhizosphaerae]|uniref:Uncharacterized protein n=1 Tax=Pseudothauera rhizosphaerae TaxID=2565932 RepID=A0A4S4ACU2_9RHOO|nr:hypothetical protein [Pseudothauera rhizosphaerae]THF56503.1 hypothetical protein E6O51_19000 [Pseudothauera rhizosphaerae]
MPDQDQDTPEQGSTGQRLLDFGIKVITEQAAKLIENLQFLYRPAEGYVTWLNDTDETVSVETFDQDDAVRWVRYEERKIAPHQAVQLTARGERIHILVKSNGCTYDCAKGLAYLFDGNNVHTKQ